MFKSYLRTAYRSLGKRKAISLINVTGLAVSMTVFVFILHYVQFESNYDRFHPDCDRIYRLRYERTTEDGQTVRFASCCPPAGALVRARYPEVEKVGRILRYRASVSFGDTKFLEENMYFADPDFLQILPFPFIKGDPSQGIRDANKAFVSESTARRYFGDRDPIGRTFSVDRKMDYVIVGVFRDIPRNSHLKFDVLLSYQNLITLYGPEFQEAWGHTGVYTYLRLRPGADPAAIEKKLVGLVDEQFGQALRNYRMTMELKLQPLPDIHLRSHFMQEYEVNGNAGVVGFLFVVAFVVMAVSWVNYVNLSTARTLERVKEAGLRKVVGASRRQLFAQSLLETAILHCVAVVMAIGLVALLMGLFAGLTGVPLGHSLWLQGWFWGSLALLLAGGVAISGFYPALVLSLYHPAQMLRGDLGASMTGMRLRKVLLVFQFVIAMALITATLVVYRQTSFMTSRDVGFDTRQVLVVTAPRVRDETYAEKWKTFKETLRQSSDVLHMCHVTEVPGRQILWDAGAIRRAGEDPTRGKNYQIVGVDYDFVDFFGLRLVCGRNFSREFPADASALMLNETAVKYMGFLDAESALGQQVDYWGDIYTVVGVLKDYHQQSLREAFEPHIYRLMPTGRDVRGKFAIRVSTQRVAQTLAMIKGQYDSFFPGNPFEYFFLDEYYDEQYKADRLLGRVTGLFTGLALFITALGLFGMASYSAVKRTREIGVRKVLGASIGSILMLLVSDFLRLIVFSFVVSLPLLIVGVNMYLQQYAFRMKIDTWLFLWPLVSVSCVTLVTVSTQVIKAATVNPVDAIRYE
ncbi:MAG: ABC transporter permease [Acidobacteriota bacterium]